MAVSATTTTPLVMIYSVFLFIFLFIFLLNPSFSVAQSDSILYSGNDLYAEQHLIYDDYTFVMKVDCNLVLYEWLPGGYSAIWASHTYGLGRSCYCSMQKYGNLVVYNSHRKPVWTSNKERGYGHYVLILQKDRNVVIYGSALWATNTNTNSLLNLNLNQLKSFSMAAKSKSESAESDSILYSGEKLSSGDSLRYGTYSFIMQTDCNLVLYDNKTWIWSSNTDGLASNCYLSMQFDGNLVIYKPDGAPLWASKTQQRKIGNYVLILQKDRNVVIYGSAIWATNTNTNSLDSKDGGGGTMNVSAPIIYSDGAKNVTGRITTRAGRVA